VLDVQEEHNAMVQGIRRATAVHNLQGTRDFHAFSTSSCSFYLSCEKNPNPSSTPTPTCCHVSCTSYGLQDWDMRGSGLDKVHCQKGHHEAVHIPENIDWKALDNEAEVGVAAHQVEVDRDWLEADMMHQNAAGTVVQGVVDMVHQEDDGQH